jgi:hypothetical protein
MVIALDMFIVPVFLLVCISSTNHYDILSIPLVMIGILLLVVCDFECQIYIFI